METGSFVGNIDVAQVVLYAFWVFFAGLIFYLRREDRREGYPLEEDTTGQVVNPGVIWIPEPKTFRRANDRSDVQAPNDKRDTRAIAAERTAVWPGATHVPTGDPMKDGVGPGSWAEREDVPDLTAHGDPLIVPMRAATSFSIADGDPDPRGMSVVGGDGAAAGSVSDVWVDKAEHLIRYLEVQLVDGSRSVLLPVNFTVFDRRRRQVKVDALLGSQFAGVPAIAKPDSITKLEEEKVCAYYGGGTLYATRQRAEPLL